MKKQVSIGVGDTATSARDFIDAWRRSEKGEKQTVEQRLYFENLETLLKTLTPIRWLLLKQLRTKGPMSIRALAKDLARDYKNVHSDVRRLEFVGLIRRTGAGKLEKIEVPWDVVEAKLMLAA